MSEQATIEGVDVLDAAPPPITTAVAEYTELCAGLNEMQKLRGMAYDLTTVRGNDQARKDRKKLVTSRTWLESRRVELNKSDRASIAERIALRDTEAARLEGLIRDLERPISEQIAADEFRREQERIDKLRAEEERMSALRTRINDIGNVAVRAVGLSSVDIEAKIALVTRIEIDASFEELEAAAGNTKFETLLRLKELHTAALASEAAALEALRTKARLELLEREDAERRVREAAAKAEADAKAQAAADAARLAAEIRQRQNATANELVDEIRRVQRRAFSASAAGMLELVGMIEAIVIGAELGDFAGVAMKARDDALADLHDMHATVLQRETDKRVADAEAVRVRAELDAARAESDRLEQIAEANRAALAAAQQPESPTQMTISVVEGPTLTVTGAIAQTLAESLDATFSAAAETAPIGAPHGMAEMAPVKVAEPPETSIERSRWDEPCTPSDVLPSENYVALIACRAALTEALDLLEGWIAFKCAKKHVKEHLAKVAELRAQGGLGVTAP